MRIDNRIVIVTLLALLMYFWTSARVARARLRHKVFTPAMTGHPDVERAIRVHMNTLEWLPLFLPSLWLFGAYVSAAVGAAIGAVWILARIYYAFAFTRDPKLRGPGFGVQALCTGVLLFGALGKAIYLLANGLTALPPP